MHSHPPHPPGGVSFYKANRINSSNFGTL
jgi:hypothetical protein